MNSIVEVENKSSSDLLPSYKDLIREVFLDPIRMVTVIDDEYPTLSAFLNEELNKHQQIENKDPGLNQAQMKAENIARLRTIMNMCHSEHKWCLDVYDGQSPRFGIDTQTHPSHINHSDLLILDYHLDENSDDGFRARNILKSLAINNYFNLVVVHTKGANEDIETVYDEILGDLINLDISNIDISDDNTDKIETWLDENDPDQDRFPLIISKLDRKDIIRTLTDDSLGINFENPDHPCHQARSEITSISKGVKLDEVLILNWIISINLSRYPDLKRSGLSNKLTWNHTKDGNFISTGRIFITVIEKEREMAINDIYDKLYHSLVIQKASPMLLLMAKIRQELDDRGIEQANSIIDNHHAQAGWLYDLVSSADKDSNKHHDAIDRHWEQLALASKKSLILFSEKIVSSLKNEHNNSTKIIETFYPNRSENDFEVLKHLNCYASTRDVNSTHLTTGTIFKIFENDTPEYWVCLTPACDLVPSQGKTKWESRIGVDHLPFQAVKLFKNTDTEKNIRKKINQNELLFININGSIETFKFKSSPNTSPTWETFYAVNHGNLDENKEFELQSLRLITGGIKQRGRGKRKRAKETKDETVLRLSNKFSAKTIVELRYEYALNLLQKFGSNQSRVGLEFVSKLWT